MLEGEDLLDRDLSSRGLVERSNDGTVCAFAEAVKDLEVVTYKICRSAGIGGTKAEGRKLTDVEGGKGLVGLARHHDWRERVGWGK